ncbi:MAG: hypothetical protein U1E27_07425 [Kiritimatiellia bacterium]|nr:hypothetical protein [Kiritimatiellia bacterium]
MISVAEAERRMLEQVSPLPPEVCPLEAASGRVLREAVMAARPAPPFDRVMMDGYALSVAAWKAGRRDYLVQTTVPAGVPPPSLADSNGAIGVMTGGVLPKGADWVVPVEWCERQAERIQIRAPSEVEPSSGLYIHAAGCDGPAGRTVLPPGVRLGPCEMAVLATENRSSVSCSPKPRIRLITTGDEVVPVGGAARPWQIYGSHAIAAS